MKSLKQKQICFVLVELLFVRDASGNSPRDVDFKSTNGTILKRTYFAAAKPVRRDRTLPLRPPYA